MTTQTALEIILPRSSYCPEFPYRRAEKRNQVAAIPPFNSLLGHPRLKHRTILRDKNRRQELTGPANFEDILRQPQAGGSGCSASLAKCSQARKMAERVGFDPNLRLDGPDAVVPLAPPLVLADSCRGPEISSPFSDSLSITPSLLLGSWRAMQRYALAGKSAGGP
jgi:hypothetical protein